MHKHNHPTLSCWNNIHKHNHPTLSCWGNIHINNYPIVIFNRVFPKSYKNNGTHAKHICVNYIYKYCPVDEVEDTVLWMRWRVLTCG